MSAGPAGGGGGPGPAAWGSREEGAGGPGRGPRAPNCASRRLQVLVQELEQYQVGAPRRPPPGPPPAPRATAAAAPRRPPPRPRAVVTRVRPVSLQLLPKRLDWEGNEHSRSYEELVSPATCPPRGLRAPGPPPPVRGAGSVGRRGQAALGRPGRRRGRGACPGRRCCALGWPGVFGWDTAPGGRGGRGGGGGGSPRRFAVVCGGVAPQVRVLPVRAGGARARALGVGGRRPFGELLSSVT